MGDSSKETVQASATGVISLGDVDVSGKFVTIKNDGTENKEVGGYFIHRVVDGADANNGFRFPCNYVLPSKHSVTIWSESYGMKANPLNDFVLEGDWLTGGKSVVTTVVNTADD